jgi:uncharacterized membrane protein YccC
VRKALLSYRIRAYIVGTLLVFLVTVAVLAAKARWSIAFTLTTVISGLVPFMTFYAERRATARVREKFPETRPDSTAVSG